MKIKTTKKMRLDELIKSVWDGDLPRKTYTSDRFALRIVFKGNGVSFNELKFGDVTESTTFTVAIEEEIKEETVFEELHEYYWDEENGLGITEIHSKQTILGIHEEHDEETIPLGIMMRHKRDNRPVLIWSRDTGIPAGGVIEV